MLRQALSQHHAGDRRRHGAKVYRMTTRSFCSAEDAVICQAVLDVQS
jgi:hypothetical protein